jgi:hypothetical protein
MSGNAKADLSFLIATQGVATQMSCEPDVKEM